MQSNRASVLLIVATSYAGRTTYIFDVTLSVHMYVWMDVGCWSTQKKGKPSLLIREVKVYSLEK